MGDEVDFSSLFGDVAGLAAIGAAYEQLGSVGTTAQSAADTLAGSVEGKSEFIPYSLSTGLNLGGAEVVYRTDGNTGYRIPQLNITAAGDALTLQDQLLAQAISATETPEVSPYLGFGTFGKTLIDEAEVERTSLIANRARLESLGGSAIDAAKEFIGDVYKPLADREQEIFDRIRATQMPDEERQRLMLEERLANQGRLGVQTNLFGGTPEQLALSRAQAEASNTAMLQAMQQARAEQAQIGALGAQYGGLAGQFSQLDQALLAEQQRRALELGTSGLGMFAGEQALLSGDLQRGLAAAQGAYIPLSAQLNAYQQALATSQLQQRGQLYGAGLFGEASMSGIDALLASGLGQANLLGNVGSGVLAAAASGGGGGLFDLIFGGLGGS
jgi:hypothetical protein